MKTNNLGRKNPKEILKCWVSSLSSRNMLRGYDEFPQERFIFLKLQLASI